LVRDEKSWQGIAEGLFSTRFALLYSIFLRQVRGCFKTRRGCLPEEVLCDGFACGIAADFFEDSTGFRRFWEAGILTHGADF
jgi:hypothetical protein